MIAHPCRQPVAIVEIDEKLFVSEGVDDAGAHRREPILQCRVGRVGTGACDDICAVLRDQLIDRGAQAAGWPHFSRDEAGREVSFFDLEADVRTRQETGEHGAIGRIDAHVDAAVWCILIAAPCYAGRRDTLRARVCLAKDTDEGSQILIV